MMVWINYKVFAETGSEADKYWYDRAIICTAEADALTCYESRKIGTVAYKIHTAWAQS